MHFFEPFLPAEYNDVVVVGAAGAKAADAGHTTGPPTDHAFITEISNLEGHRMNKFTERSMTE